MELFQSDIKRIDISDAQASGLLGTWKDDNENEYTFKKDGTVVIKGSSGKTKGTFGVVKDAEGILKLNLVMEGGSLEYEYTFGSGIVQSGNGHDTPVDKSIGYMI